jgi:hypothetical protein
MTGVFISVSNGRWIVVDKGTAAMFFLDTFLTLIVWRCKYPRRGYR